MSKIRVALIVVAIYAALGIALMMFIIKYQNDLGKQEAIAGQEKVIAHITALQPNVQEGKEETYYNVYYEYWAEDGTRYWGEVLVLTYDREYALSLIGNEVEIYIDGKGHSIQVSEAENFNVDYHKNICIIICSIIAGYTIILVAILIRSHIASGPKKKIKKSE
ncbi:MAG: hypothetical protein K2M95_00730 [Clostridiales bacterium]|nr:hypothetical protein [Clostridiales bacterium]